MPRLSAIENLRPKEKKPQKPAIKQILKEKPVKAKDITLDDLLKAAQPVRVPRTTPTYMDKRKDAVLEGAALMDTKKTPIGKNSVTVERREQVLGWMLNGHQHCGKLMSERQLAVALDAEENIIFQDIKALKDKMGDFFVDNNNTEIPALAYILMEMKFQDRGRALSIYNQIVGDIAEEDERADWVRKEVKAGKLSPEVLAKMHRLTGRDRAAMYSSALAALDLSNKATNGMDNLFKMAGGAAKLQNILKAKNVQINHYNGEMVSLKGLQEFASKELGAVLPSNRLLNGGSVPATLDLTLEDKEILMVGEREVKK